MGQLTYQPWHLLERYSNDLNRRIFDDAEGSASSIATWTPAVDIKEEDERFVLHADVPGVDPHDIEVTMEDGVLTVRGERASETKDEKDGYKRVERTSGSFYRRFVLPDTTDGENISASYDKGVLELVIPKKPATQPKRIKVKDL
ncbi:MAG: heat-shock protein Hsp20 [Cycloclasticus sp. symbiont of Poecilosclerida sp. M]|nr:MAG: heat-shock protein Hsp20 [Cycloclasticus sp. symbiont of Poecilosclerida sp. M]